MGGCGTPLIKDKKIDYKRGKTLPSLEVPPELSATRK
jgi:hypothetical protein